MAYIKHLVDLDLNKNQLLNTKLQNLGSHPSVTAGADEGFVYWNTADDTAYVYTGVGTVWVDLGSDGITNLNYSASASNGVVTSNTGTDATIPLATTSNAGLLQPSDKTKLNSTSGTNTGNNATNSQYSGLVSNVSTNLSEGATTTTTVAVNSSDGSNATLAQASTTRAGVMSKAKFDEVTANSLKTSDINHNVSTNLSEGSTTTTSVKVNSSDGGDATLLQASSARAGVLSSAKFNEIQANTLKTSDINHNTVTNITIVEAPTNVSVQSSDGGNDTIAAANGTNAGVMTTTMFDEHTANNAKTSDINHNVSTNLGISKSATTNIITSSDGNNATITSATSTNAGLMTKALFDQHVVNTGKTSDINHNVSTNLSTSRNSTTNTIISSDGSNALISSATSSLAGVMTGADKAKLDGIEAGADKTDSTNVNAAGAVMNSDTSTSAMNFVIDEDNMSSNSSTKVPTQQSVKAYVNSLVVNAKSYQGGYNASTDSPSLDDGTPVSGIKSGDVYDVTVAGNFFSVSVEVGDSLRATQDSPTSVSHWTIVQANLTSASIKTQYESNSNTNAFTDGEKTKLSSQSNTNTGDELPASTTVAGVMETATQSEVNAGTSGNRAVIPSTLRSTLGITSSLSTTLTYSALIGNGSLTTIPVTHAIGNRFVQANVYEVADDMGLVECEIELTSTTVTTFKFNVAPASNALRVVIIG